MKTSELTGLALDWAVFTALRGAIASSWYIKDGCFMAEEGEVSWKYQPSTDWRNGGAIIEREKIELSYDDAIGWTAAYMDARGLVECIGSTPLIAAMRCYVASKLGDEVDIPDEVTPC